MGTYQRLYGKQMIIDCISDTHGHLPKLEGGDLLILAGDYTAADKLTQWSDFFHWLAEQKYEKKILIAGNHDNFFESGFPKNQFEADQLKEVIDFLDTDVDFEYLCDSGTEYKGLKIWGTPWTPWFHGVNPKCKAFMKSESKIASKFSLIPEDTDILITHSPPYNILDWNLNGNSCGSQSLLEKSRSLKNLKLFVFGHIHESYSIINTRVIQDSMHMLLSDNKPNSLPIIVNASHVNEKYQPVNKPIRVIL